MKIINKSSFTSFDVNQLAGKTSQILSSGLAEHTDFFFNRIKEMRHLDDDGIYLLMAHIVNIELVDKSTNENHREEGIIETLGAYYSQGKHYPPTIQLYMNPIASAANNCSGSIDDLAAVVLIHELAHMFMDVTLFSDEANLTPYNTDYGRWREESFANAIALSILNHSDNKTLAIFAHSFIKTQPKEYALGEIMYEITSSHRVDFIIKCRRHPEKWNGVCKKLQQDWLEAANCADANKLKALEEAINYQNDTVFCLGEFRRKKDAVKVVIDDYCNKKGIIYLSDLQNVFPAKDHTPWTEYKTYSEEYHHQFYFADPICKNEKGQNIYLYDRWGDPRNQDFEEFLAEAEKVGYSIELLN